MKYFLNRTALTLVAVGVSVLIGDNCQMRAQDAAKEGGASISVTQPSSIKTLDDLRRIETGDGSYSFVEVPDKGVVGPIRKSPAESKNAAMDALRKHQQRLSDPGVNRIEAEQSLRRALTEYFVRDMQARVKELDKIKAKVAETEAKLQKRLESQKEAIDLQMQIMIREADGLGFFSTANPTADPAYSRDDIISGTPFSPSNGYPNATDPFEVTYEPVAATVDAVKEILTSTQTLSLVLEDSSWNHYRLPASFGDEEFGKLAAAILKALGPNSDSKSLRWAKNAATLEVRFTWERYEEFGDRIPDVIEKLKESSDLRQKQRNEAATSELLGR